MTREVTQGRLPGRPLRSPTKVRRGYFRKVEWSGVGSEEDFEE